MYTGVRSCVQAQLAIRTAKPDIDLEALSPGDASAPSIEQPRFGRVPGRRASPRRKGPRGLGHCGHLSHSHTQSFRGSAATGGVLGSKGADPAAQLLSSADYRAALEQDADAAEVRVDDDALSVRLGDCLVEPAAAAFVGCTNASSDETILAAAFVAALLWMTLDLLPPLCLLPSVSSSYSSSSSSPSSPSHPAGLSCGQCPPRVVASCADRYQAVTRDLPPTPRLAGRRLECHGTVGLRCSLHSSCQICRIGTCSYQAAALQQRALSI